MKKIIIALLSSITILTAIGQTCSKSLTTTFAGGNGGSGNMFDVTTLNIFSGTKN